jgi:hypothetical protein
MKSVFAVVAICLIYTCTAFGQWTKDPAKIDPSASAPRTADGKIDLSGVWLPDVDPKGAPLGVEHQVFSQYFVDITAGMKPADVPILPAARELLMKRLQSNGTDSPQAHCKPSGIPWANSIPLPYKIVQTPQLILILYEENSIFRQVFMNGRQPVKDPEPRWMGYSTGRWDGDTLVVETTGFNDQTWLDAMGHPHSTDLRLTERFRRRDAGHLDIDVTINDPKSYSKPITYTQKTTQQSGEDLLEYFCTENEKDVQSFK